MSDYMVFFCGAYTTSLKKLRRVAMFRSSLFVRPLRYATSLPIKSGLLHSASPKKSKRYWAIGLRS